MLISVAFVSALIAVFAVALPSNLIGVARRADASTLPTVVPISRGTLPASKSANAVSPEVTLTDIYQSGVAVMRDEGDFTSVTASFSLPAANRSIGDAQMSRVASIVGFDLEANCSTFVLGGFQVVVLEDSATLYQPFYQWGNQTTASFDNIQAGLGDTITVTVQAADKGTSASITMQKNPGNQLQTVNLNFPDDPLCLKSPNWLVSIVPGWPLAIFNDVIFNTPSAMEGSLSVGPNDPFAFVYNIEQDGKVITDVERETQDITVKYTP